MRRENYVLTVGVAALSVCLAGCGSSTNTTQNPVSGLKKRVLITNSQNSAVQLLDAQGDKFNKALGTTAPTRIVTSVSSGITVVLNSTVSQISIIDNTKETVSNVGVLAAPASDVAVSPDGKRAYAAVRSSGLIEVFDTSNGNLVTTIPVPSVTRLVMGPKGSKLLAFSDDPQSLASPNTNAFFVIDTASNTVTHIAGPAGSQPYTAVFDPSDTNDTTAFILFCGPECAGTAPTAGVSRVNFSGAPVFSPASPIPVGGATVGLLSGSNLFVAGTPVPPAPPAGCTLTVCGSLQIINTGTLTAGTPIPITDGLHTQMALTSNNHLYIGARDCTPGTVSPSNQVRGCLSIFNTGAAVSATNPLFPVESSFRSDLNVTGLQTISGRSIIYVIQGGELDILDFTSDSLTANQLDVVGHATGVVLIDP